MSENPESSQSDSPRHTLSTRRLLRRYLIGIGVIAVVCVGTCVAPGWVLGWRTKREQVAALRDASDPEARNKAVGNHGAVLSLNDGSWIAISYRDNHSVPFAFSSTVARCSDGTWMDSRHHFCAQIRAYAYQRDMYRHWMEEATTPGEREVSRKLLEEAGSDTLLDEAEAARSLSEAKELLRQMGLTPMRAPR